MSGTIFIYYLENDTGEQVSPDLFVVKGVPKHRRRYYQTWVEGKAPDFVLEVTSKKTKSEDLNYKYELYEQILKVPEYFLFDPISEYLHPPLHGYRLVSGQYSPIAEIGGRLRSEELNLEFQAERCLLEEIFERIFVLRIYNPLTGEKLLTTDELVEAVRRKTAARLEAEVRLEAELELEQLRKELEMLRAQHER